MTIESKSMKQMSDIISQHAAQRAAWEETHLMAVSRNQRRDNVVSQTIAQLKEHSYKILTPFDVCIAKQDTQKHAILSMAIAARVGDGQRRW